MKPDPTRVLEVTAASLLTEVAPSLSAAYAQSSVGVQGILLASVREEFDRAAARRVEENRALRELFAEAALAVADASLRGRLERAAASRDESLRVPDLQAGNEALRALLVELHAHVEGLSDAGARRVEAAIWRELRLSTERRKLALGPF